VTETPIRYVSFTVRTWNQYPEYKDSGINWLGQIPAHWEVGRLKQHARFDNSGVWGSEPETCDSPMPVARTADISMDGQINFGDMPRRCIPDSEMRAYTCRSGEIIVVKSSGSISSVVTGKAALAAISSCESCLIEALGIRDSFSPS